jgi:hypothetical protein
MEPVLSLLGHGGLPVFRPAQVHGARVIRIGASEHPSSFREKGDALATRRRGIVLAVGSADCVPVILFDSRSGAGAVAHAGWRGTLALIARGAVEFLHSEWGSSPGDLRALIGPGIGPCCYRVGQEGFRAFRDAGIDWEGLERKEGEASHLDLPGTNRLILERAGIPPEQIVASGLCTRCRDDLFPSYRREGPSAGRLLSFLGSSPIP